MQTRSVCATSPSKTILFGEHSVVYGQPALVSALDSRLKLSVTKNIGRDSDELSRPCLLIRLLDANIVLSRSNVEEFLQTININRYDRSYHEEVKAWVTSKLPNSASLSVSDACSAILSIFTHDGIITFDRLEVAIESEIPVGAGLGSSAALSVAAAACCLVLDDKLSMTSDDWSSEDREQISDLAFIGETVFHGSPSGLDNTISTFGGLLSYTRGVGMTLLPTKLNVKILVIDTKVPRTTSAMVDGVRRRREEDTEKYDEIFSEIGELVGELIQLLTTNEEIGNEIIKPVKRNQELLKDMGVSHKVIDDVVDLMTEFGISAKLTGAGGGGCVIAFLPSDFINESEVIGKLTEIGLEAWSTTVGADGVRIVDT